MADLFINPDGANYQAQAVLAYLRGHDGIEQSWDGHRYAAEPQVDRWHNCREQGYVVSLRSFGYGDQINIAFFEHRNSDRICAVKWRGTTPNPPSINDIPKSHSFFADKYAVDHSVAHGEAAEMAAWIFDQLSVFWRETSAKKLKAVRS